MPWYVTQMFSVKHNTGSFKQKAVGDSQNLGMDLVQLFTNTAGWETDLDKNKNMFICN